VTVLGAALWHFFPDFNLWLDALADPRRLEQITYPLRFLVWELVELVLSDGGSTRQWISQSSRYGFLRSVQDFSGIAGRTAAHPGTLFYLLSKLAPRELIGFQAKLVHRLIRMRCLDHLRFGGEWLVAVDGVWLRTYPKRHCPHCLHQTKEGKSVYFHAVLEAKLLLANGMAISMGSVPIENPDRPYDKQDCESKAFVRLAALLHELFPRLPMCIVGDSLYGCAPVIAECKHYGWSYILVFKPGRLPLLWEEASKKWTAREPVPQQRPNGVKQLFRYVTGLTYAGHTLHAIHCLETKPDGTQNTWAWITDLRPDPVTVQVIANQGGRPRDLIEQAFNVQKNGEFELRHDYGSQERAWYNLYLIVQIAHLLLQLMSFTDLVKRLSHNTKEDFHHAFDTVRNFFRLLAESFQRDSPDPFWCGPTAESIQVRFCSA
jgi:hypothetical protein